MGENNKEKQEPKLECCPFLNDTCVGDKCQLWASATVPRRGTLGQLQMMTMTGCAFVLQLALHVPNLAIPPGQAR